MDIVQCTHMCVSLFLTHLFSLFLDVRMNIKRSLQPQMSSDSARSARLNFNCSYSSLFCLNCSSSSRCPVSAVDGAHSHHLCIYFWVCCRRRFANRTSFACRARQWSMNSNINKKWKLARQCDEERKKKTTATTIILSIRPLLLLFSLLAVRNQQTDFMDMNF